MLVPIVLACVAVALQESSAPTLAFDPAGAVLKPGPAGAWDSFATYSPFLVEHGDQYLLFYTGFASPDYSDGAIGLATSSDGVCWTKVGDAPLVCGTGELTRIQCAVAGRAADGTWFLLANGARRGEVTGPCTWLWRAPEPRGPWVAHAAPVLKAEAGAWWAMNVPSGLVTWKLEDMPATDDPAHRGCDPVLERGVAEWEREGIALYTPFARKSGGYEAFYVGFSANPLPSFRLPHSFGLGHATSRDGVTWKLSQAALLLDTKETLWPAVSAPVIGERTHAYMELEGGQKGLALLSGKLGK